MYLGTCLRPFLLQSPLGVCSTVGDLPRLGLSAIQVLGGLFVHMSIRISISRV